MTPKLYLSEAVIDAKATSDRRVHLGRMAFLESPKNQLRMGELLPISGQQPSTGRIGRIQIIRGLWPFT